MHRTVTLPLVLLLTACDLGRPPLPPPEDAVACAASHAAALSACQPDAPDPLADAQCADALRVAVRSCRAAALTAPK